MNVTERDHELQPETRRFAHWAARRTMVEFPRWWVAANLDDLYQHARIAAWRAQCDFRQGGRTFRSFVTLYVQRELWLVRNEALRQKRGGGCLTESLDALMTPDGTPFAEALEGDAGDYLSPLILADEVRRCTAALETLPTAQREALRLQYVRGLDGPESAALLGCKLTTLRVRRCNGLAKLRAILEGSAMLTTSHESREGC